MELGQARFPALAISLNTMKSEMCPFKVGQIVYYRPSQRGLDADVMSPQEHRLVPGNAYLIAEIREGKYVFPKDYKHPGGGLYWTEFAPQ
jgi:hypothetical protein